MRKAAKRKTCWLLLAASALALIGSWPAPLRASITPASTSSHAVLPLETRAELSAENRQFSVEPLALTPETASSYYDPLGNIASDSPVAPIRGLPAPSPTAKLLQRDLDHIIARHWPTSGARGAGKFADGTTGKSLLEMIKEGVGKGVSRPNTRNRPGTIFEYDFGRQIGVDISGNPARRIRVVVRPDGTVVTAFPF